MVNVSLDRVKASDRTIANLREAVEVLKKVDFQDTADGRYFVHDDLFYDVQSFSVSSDKPIDVDFETHTKYIDIQLCVEGKLNIKFADVKDLTENKPYEPEGDITFYDKIPEADEVNLTAGQYTFIFPENAHRMYCVPESGKTETIRKVVCKVLYEG